MIKVAKAAVMAPGSRSEAQTEREWAPGEAEATLRSQLSRLGLSQEDANSIVQETLYSGPAGCDIVDVEDVW